jgi:hypothetical protein
MIHTYILAIGQLTVMLVTAWNAAGCAMGFASHSFKRVFDNSRPAIARGGCKPERILQRLTLKS